MLRFALADIPVRVHFSFLLIAVLAPSPRAIDIAAWIVAVFVAVLLHELGHAVVARHYGARPVTITLFALGGVTMYPAAADLTPGRRFLISAAGSFVGILTGGLLGLLWLAGAFDGSAQVVRVAAFSYVWAALGWGLLNWIPIRPLDGGAMLTSLLEIVAPRRALTIARAVSAVTGAAAAFVLWRMGFTFGAVFVLFITVVGMRPDPTAARSGTSGHRRPEVDDATDRTRTDRPDPPSFPI